MCEEYERLKDEEAEAVAEVVRAESALERSAALGPGISREDAIEWERVKYDLTKAQQARLQAYHRVVEHLKAHRCGGR